MSFHFLDHTGDVGFTAEAPTLAELIVEAIAAFTAIVTEPEKLGDDEVRKLTVTAESPDLLLHGVLEELLYRFEVGGFLPRSARVVAEQRGSEWHAEIEAAGERRDATRHPIKVLVKAITYHALSVEQVDGLWRAKVIFDI
ncbi:MAG: archease [Holophagales bacterium]|nr:MAG: archease [Holophagales bacterium]